MKTDIIFLSYNESNAEANWQALKARFPQAKRVHGVQGIANAHKAAADTSETEFFFVVDGDNVIVPEFDFSTDGLDLKSDTIYIWRCRNPVNDLVYGYGAVKLYNKSLLTKRYENQFVDLASTVTEKYKIIHQVASETRFYETPEEAWRGAFRECAKLASESIHRQKTDETHQRLKTWCEMAHFVPNSQWVLLGARQGRKFGEQVRDQRQSLKKINDFSWLHRSFQEQYKTHHKQVSVIIPTHNRHEDVLRLLDSIEIQSLPKSFFEVLVVSNLEDLKLQQKIIEKNYQSDIRFFSVGKVGVNRARNLGLEQARGDIGFFLDDDCELIDENHLSILRAQHAYHPQALAVGGGYEIPKGISRVARVYHYLASYWFDAQSSQGSLAQNLLGGNVSYKLGLLRRHGLKFHPGIVFGGAESEFHARLVARGFELRNTPVNVRHHLKMNLSDFYRKAFMQGMGLERTTRFLEKKAPESWSPRGTWKFFFMRYHYDRVFNKGRLWVRQNKSMAPESLPFQNEGWGLFLQNTVSAMIVIPLSYIFWTAYHWAGVTRTIVKKVLIHSFWKAYSLASLVTGVAKRVVVFAYWKMVVLASLTKIVGLYLFWKTYSGLSLLSGIAKRILVFGYWKMVAVASFAKRLGIFAFWKTYPIYSYFKGQFKKYSIKSYWFLYYMRKQFHKDLQKKIQLWYFGVDTNNLPGSLKLADHPSLYLPVSGDCKARCSYCPQVKAKWSGEASLPRPGSDELSSMGFSGVTFPCNFLTLSEAEQRERFASYRPVGQELMINPDFFSGSNPWSMEKLENYIFSVKSPKVLLLYRPGKQFAKILEDIKEALVPVRIVFLFDVSGEPKKMYQTLDPEDWGKVQFLNSTNVSPDVTDDRNRKLAPKVGRAIKHFQLKSYDFWPQTSHVHYPFLVSDDSKANVWLQGGVSWQSPSVESMAETPKYSIIVPVRYQIDHARKVLKNLSHQEYDSHQFELLFVDDGNDKDLGPSIEDSWRQIGEPDLNIKVIRYPRDTELGFDTNYRAGQARNMGLRYSKGERILFVDSDILIAPDLFEKLDQSLTDYMIIQFPRYMLTEEATKNFSDYSSLKLDEHTYSQSKYWEEFKRAENWMDLKNYWKYTCTYGLCLTRKTLQKTGPFRTDFIFYGFEDVDLGYRLFQRGGKFLLLKSPVFHLYPDQNHSFHFDAEKRYQALSRSATIFFQRNMDLNFYFDLKGFLNRPWHIRMRKPYYTAKYHAQSRLPFLFGSPDA